MAMVPYVAESAMTSFGVGGAVSPEAAGFGIGLGIGGEIVRRGSETLRDRLTEFMHYGANQIVEYGEQQLQQAGRNFKRVWSNKPVKMFDSGNLAEKRYRLDRNRGAPANYSSRAFKTYSKGPGTAAPIAALFVRKRKRTYNKRKY